MHTLPRALPISALCAIWLGLAAGPARAQSAPFVAWDAPAECPDGDDFRRALDRHLSAPPARPIHVEVRIARQGARYRLDMHTTEASATGDRTLTGRDCAVLVETAALTLALAIDPQASPPAAAEPGVRETENPPVPAGRPSGTVHAVPDHSEELGLDLTARGLVSVDIGSFPGTAPGAGAALATALGRLRLEARGAYWFERTARLAADPEDGGHLSTLAAGLRACWRLRGGRAAVEACAGAELLRTTGRGFGGFDSQSGSHTWMSAQAGPSLAFNLLKRLTFRVDLEAVARPLVRPVFQFDNVDPAGEPFVIHKPAWIGGRASAGLEVSFR